MTAPDLAGSDSVGFVVGQLLLPPAVGLVDGLAHAVRDLVRIHDHLSVDIPGSTSGSLCQGTVRAQESFLVCIQDGYEGHFRQIESLTQQVDTDQDVENTLTQFFHDLHPLQGFHIAVDIGTADAVA